MNAMEKSTIPASVAEIGITSRGKYTIGVKICAGTALDGVDIADGLRRRRPRRADRVEVIKR